jgi:hypothetical protein
LPLGVQTFRKIIEGGYVYADKTAAIADLARAGQYFFLSRPRRFGKSLFVDTLKEAFSGHRELFEGLALAATDFDFTPHPVIRLDLSGFDSSDPEAVRLGLDNSLRQTAAEAGVEVDGANPSILFGNLIRALHAAAGQRVVVLIDEYDKPIIDHLDDVSLAEANRAVLGGFYGILKSRDADLAFVFLTGVSKFARTSVFSQLNNLTDVTMNPSFATIAGFTPNDLDRLFADRLARVAGGRRDRGLPFADPDSLRAEVFRWYDGYSWDGANRVFNPYSLLRFFSDERFNAYWYATGTPKFLVDYLARRPGGFPELDRQTITEVELDSHAIEEAPLPSLLFQSGFLTVTAVDRSQEMEVYHLGFPNREVTESLSRVLFRSLTQNGADVDTWARPLRQALDEGRPEFLQEALTGLYALIPYHLHGHDEAFYDGVFYVVMRFLGFTLRAEAPVARGRLDGQLDAANGHSYVIEFKYGVTGEGVDPAALLDRLADEALDQIDAGHYADQYAGSGRTVHKVGVAVTGRGEVLAKTR